MAGIRLPEQACRPEWLSIEETTPMDRRGRSAIKLQIPDANRAELKALLRVRKAPEDESLGMTALTSAKRRWS